MGQMPADSSPTEGRRSSGPAVVQPKSRAHVSLALVVGIALDARGLPSAVVLPAACMVRAKERAGSGRTSTATSTDWGRKSACLPHAWRPRARAGAVHEVATFKARPTASQFKLFVLGALARQIAAGRISWDQTLTVEDAVKSLGNGAGSLQFAAPGTVVSVEQTAMSMISISDNTAADMLIGLVGRNAVEAQVRRWTANAAANEPFLTTREVFLLHYVAGLADRYLATPRGQRAAFLASSVDPLPLSDIASGFSLDPRYVDEIEWFASPIDVCRAFAGLQMLSRQPALSPLSTILALQPGGNGPDASVWPTVWYKGGSEPGVLTLGWLATNRHGETYVVEAMVSNPDAALSADSIPDLVSIAKRTFDLLDQSISFTRSPTQDVARPH